MPRAIDQPLAGAPDPWAPSGMPPFRSRPPYLMTEMIAAEPALADRLVHRLATDDAVAELVQAVTNAAERGAAVMTTGCGTSEHAAMGIAHLLNEVLRPIAGREVRPMQAADALARPPDDGVLVAVSHEGGTRATNEAIAAAHAAGARTALITVGGGSPGAALADIVIRTQEQDRSWCHTVGYLSPLIAGVVLADRLAGSKTDARAVHALLDVSADSRAAAGAASGLTGTDRIIVLGSGADHVAARELALKIAEGARLPASAHDLETVMHGHLAAATRWTGIVVILTDVDPRTRERADRVFAAARALGLSTAAILGDRAVTPVAAEVTGAGRMSVPSIPRLRPVVRSLLGSAIPLQLLAERLARARGVDPDTLAREDPAQAAAHA
jgi:glutamine---fructose-6-phosphate transaminase (isomerizing)